MNPQPLTVERSSDTTCVDLDIPEVRLLLSKGRTCTVVIVGRGRKYSDSEHIAWVPVFSWKFVCVVFLCEIYTGKSFTACALKVEFWKLIVTLNDQSPLDFLWSVWKKKFYENRSWVSQGCGGSHFIRLLTLTSSFCLTFLGSEYPISWSICTGPGSLLSLGSASGQKKSTMLGCWHVSSSSPDPTIESL